MLRKMVVLGAAFGVIATGACSAKPPVPAVKEQAQVPEADGMTDVTVFKVRKRLDTVTCRDFNLVDESFRPKAVEYAANYGPKGKPHPTVTVDGIEKIVPIVVANCQVQPGDHFAATVHRAIAQEQAGHKKPAN